MVEGLRWAFESLAGTRALQITFESIVKRCCCFSLPVPQGSESTERGSSRRPAPEQSFCSVVAGENGPRDWASHEIALDKTRIHRVL
jgi:hypothetical protein